MLAFVPQDRYGWTPLHCAAHQGNKDCVRLLLQYGADVTKVNREGKSALHLAAAQNRAAIVQMLLEAGADANLQDQVGMTPVHESTYRGHFPLYNEFARQPHVETDTLDILKRTAADYIDKPPMSASASSRRVKTPIK